MHPPPLMSAEPSAPIGENTAEKVIGLQNQPYDRVSASMVSIVNQ
jgi:hypothetical protein